MTITETDVTAPEAAPVAEAEKPAAQLFEWSRWLHCGPGAEECEHRFDGRCEGDHFHAWVRLPNPFQAEDIMEKAKAARARRLRILRDPDSDPRVTLELELEDARAADKETLAEEVLDRDWAQDYTLAVRAVADMEDPDYVVKDEEAIPKLYDGIEQDQEEYQRLKEVPEDQRDAAEWDHLRERVAAYARAVDAELESIQKPKRDRLLDHDKERLIELIREARIEADAFNAYRRAYNAWMWMVCTFKPREKGTPNERVWKDVNAMRQETAPEVVVALRDTFDELEGRLARKRMSGNA